MSSSLLSLVASWLFVAFVVYRYRIHLADIFRRFQGDTPKLPYTSAKDSSPESVEASYQPSHGTLPDPDPWLDFDLSTAATRNRAYRFFGITASEVADGKFDPDIYVNKTLRHPYFQTMAHQVCEVANRPLMTRSRESLHPPQPLQPMHINDWIEIDKVSLRDARRKDRDHKSDVPKYLYSRTLPGISTRSKRRSPSKAKW